MSQPINFYRPVSDNEVPAFETWPVAEILALYELPFNELLFRAQEIHRANFPEGDVELATLICLYRRLWLLFPIHSSQYGSRTQQNAVA